MHKFTVCDQKGYTKYIFQYVHIMFVVQYGPVQFGLVAMNSPGLTYRQACTYYPVTCDAARVHQWLKELRCTFREL